MESVAVKVVQLMRRAPRGAFSLERLFQDIRDHMPSDVQVEVWRCPFESRGLWRRLANSMAAVAVRADVCHVTGDVHYLTYLLRKRRTVLTVHDCVTIDRRRGWHRAILKLLWFTLPIRRSALVVAISESTKRAILAHVPCPSDKIHVIHDCVSGNFLSVPKPFDASCPRILFVGTNPNKNLTRASQALTGISCRLVIVGRLTEVQRKSLDDAGLNYDNLVNLSDDDLRREYERCDIVLFPSTYEGFGLPIVEGQAVGRPVVTSNIWSMPEVAGKGACLVDPWSPASIRDGVLRVITDQNYRQQLVEAGTENVKRFQPTSVASRYAALYHEVGDRKAIARPQGESDLSC